MWYIRRYTRRYVIIICRDLATWSVIYIFINIYLGNYLSGNNENCLTEMITKNKLFRKKFNGAGRTWGEVSRRLRRDWGWLIKVSKTIWHFEDRAMCLHSDKKLERVTLWGITLERYLKADKKRFWNNFRLQGKFLRSNSRTFTCGSRLKELNYTRGLAWMGVLISKWSGLCL